MLTTMKPAPDRAVSLSMRDGQYLAESDLAQIVRREREKTGETQTEFAARFGVAQSHISRAENAENADTALHSLRVRIIEELTGYEISSLPFYRATRKGSTLAGAKRAGKA